jgi:UrcA family protein
MPNTTQMLRTALRGSIVLAAAVLGTGAIAQSSSIDVSGRSDAAGDVTRSKILAISDLNLADASGQRRLDQRIRYTASYVCNDGGLLGTRRTKDYDRCYSAALTGAQSKVAQRIASGDMRPIRVAAR